jgi:hypothetical protein
MLRTTAIGLAALWLTLAALTPALADVPQCMKQPNADTCPTMGAPSKVTAQAAPKTQARVLSPRSRTTEGLARPIRLD